MASRQQAAEQLEEEEEEEEGKLAGLGGAQVAALHANQSFLLKVRQP